MPKPYAKNKNEHGVVTSVGYHCRSCNTARSRKYRQTPRGKERVYAAIVAAAKRDPDKTKARGKVGYALKTNSIQRPKNCTNCLAKKELDAHHPDYSRPLDVVWLCRQCHADVHRI